MDHVHEDFDVCVRPEHVPVTPPLEHKAKRGTACRHEPSTYGSRNGFTAGDRGHQSR